MRKTPYNHSSNQEQEIVERLQTLLTELRRLPFRPGIAGSSLLDVLEAMEEERTLLSHSPAALSGWRLGGVIGNDGVKKPPSTIMPVRRHEREAGLRLIQRSRAAAPRTE